MSAPEAPAPRWVYWSVIIFLAALLWGAVLVLANLGWRAMA